MAGGLAPATPVAAVRWGTRPDQATVRTTLAGLGDATARTARHHRRSAPVAGLDLDWFERRPLFGRGSSSPGPAGRPSALAASAAEPRRRADRGADHRGGRGGRRGCRPAGGGRRRLAAGGYDWVVFTSPHAVERLAAAAARRPEPSASAQVAAIGPGTAGPPWPSAAWSPTWCRPSSSPRRSSTRSPPARAGARPAAAGGRRPRRPARRAAGQGLGGRRRRGLPDRARRARPTGGPGGGRRRRCHHLHLVVDGHQLPRRRRDRPRCPRSWSASGRSPRPRRAAAGIHVDVVADEHSIDGLVAALLEGLAATGPARR